MIAYRRSPYLALDWDGPDLILLQCNQNRRFHVNDETVRVLTGLATWTSEEKVAGPGSSVSIDELARLVDAGVLERRDLSGATDGQAAKTGWTVFELAVQRRHNQPFEQVTHGSEAVGPGARMSGPRVALPRGRLLEQSLSEVLAARRSWRAYADRPVSLVDLSTLLRHAAAADPSGNGGGRAPWRPYPTAGGLDELELYVVANDVQGLSPGTYYFEPPTHSLRLARPPGAEQDQLNVQVNASTGGALNRVPPIVLMITARFGPTLSKYPGIGLSLVYKNTGCLFQTLYLVATALGMAPCAIGGGPEAQIARWLGLDPLEESQVGTFLLGYPDDSRPIAPRVTS
jgi:SagB-type dehydrogenase family enzyme